MGQLALGEDRDIQAAGLRRHQLLSAVFEDAHEADYSFHRVVGRGLYSHDGLLQVSDVGGGIAVHERPGQVDLDPKWWNAFPLLEVSAGRTMLADYYDGYAAIAGVSGAGLMLESPTWRGESGVGRTAQILRSGFGTGQQVRA